MDENEATSKGEKKKEEKEEQMKTENGEEIQPNQEQQEIIEGIDSETNTHQPDTLERLLENGWTKKKMNQGKQHRKQMDKLKQENMRDAGAANEVKSSRRRRRMKEKQKKEKKRKIHTALIHWGNFLKTG